MENVLKNTKCADKKSSKYEFDNQIQKLFSALPNVQHMYDRCDKYVIHVWCFSVLHM